MVEPIVRLLDVAPTLLDFLGIARPAAFHGESLRSAIVGASAPAMAYGETRRSGRSLHYYVDSEADAKLVLDMNTGARWLYSLSADPSEKHDLAAEQSLLADRLERRLRSLVQELDLPPGSEPRPMDAEELARLRDLGYL